MPDQPDADARGVADESADVWDEENDVVYLKYMFGGSRVFDL